MPPIWRTCPHCQVMFSTVTVNEGAPCPACGRPPLAPPAALWYRARNKAREGPFTLDQLREAVRTGDLQASDMLLRDGAPRWAPASTVPELFVPQLVSLPAPLPTVLPAPEPRAPRRLGLWLALGLVGVLLGTVLLVLILPRSRKTREEAVSSREDGDTGKPAKRPALSDASAYNERGIAALRAGQFAEAVDDFTQAIRLAPDRAEVHANRGFAHERLGKRRLAEKDFAEAKKQHDARGDSGPLKVGDRVVTVRPINSGNRRLLEPGTGLEVTGRREGWVTVRWPGGRVVGDLHAQTLTRDRKGDDEVYAAKGSELLALLKATLTGHRCVQITLRAGPVGEARGVQFEAWGFGLAPSGPAKARRRWSGTARSGDWDKMATLLLDRAEFLTDCSPTPAPEPGRAGRSVVRLFFHFPPRRHLPACKDDHLFLSRTTQRYLRVTEESDYPATRRVLIIEEPHWHVDLQVNLFRGLDSLFADNPFLFGKGRAAYLAEGWPAGKPLPVKPLIKAIPRPSNSLIRDVLDTYLIPAYVAHEWKHQRGIPILGHEDPDLYGLAVKYWSKPLTVTGISLWRQAVFARNRSMARTLLAQLERAECPILFIGGLHLHAVPTVDKLSPAAWENLRKSSTPEEWKKLKDAEKRGIVEYLKEKKIGYYFLDAVAHPHQGDSSTKEMARYRELFVAQAAKNVPDYLRRHIYPRTKGARAGKKGTTSAPNPEAAALAAQAIQKGGFEGGSKSGAIGIRARLANLCSRIKWLAFARFGGGGDGTPRDKGPYKTKPMLGKYVDQDKDSHVEYLDKDSREQYLVEVKDGLLYDALGNLFDTTDSLVGYDEAGAIYVMDEFGRIYVKKNPERNKFHHSSFLAGGAVAGAGTIKVRKGVIELVDRQSGHYHPDEAFREQVVAELKKRGVDVKHLTRLPRP